MKQENKSQIQSILALLTRRHPLVCEAVLSAARGCLPSEQRDIVLALTPVDGMGNVAAGAVARLESLVAAVNAIVTDEELEAANGQ